MTRFKSILVATDFSVDATHAVRKAALLAEHHAARLTLLHVVNPAGFKPLRQWFAPSIDVDLKAAQARATLRRFAAEINGRHGVPARCRVVVGESFDEIRRASEGADLVVLGQRGRNPIKDLVTGSTADRLLRSCRRATLVVKQPLDRFYRSILVPVDFTACSQACLQSAASLVQTADIHVFHALDPVEEFEMRMAGVPAAVIRDHSDIVDRKAHDRMHGIAAKAGVESSRVRTIVRRGPAWACALDQADKVGADLIVIGKQGTSTMAEFFLGRVTRRLLARSKCDVMVMPRAAVEAACARPDLALRPDHSRRVSCLSSSR
ncbi:universal stress protein [Piscinibacter sp. XHJ-5]|uniref:universal stress protein n=1 Tax=Piscinibacter sp. XHJ-5 TaxID=3037797 RepID=UPI002453043F|nr:universal stress protein [Piscinibacter sp. XHJ-5]